MQTDQPIPATRVDLTFIKKKNTYDTVDFAVLLDHRMEIKGRRKLHKGLDLAREQKKRFEI